MNDVKEILSAVWELAGGLGLAMAAIVAIFFALWLVMTGWKQFFLIADTILGLLVFATGRVGNGLRNAVEIILHITWSLIFTLLLIVTAPFKHYAMIVHEAVTEYCKLWHLFWKSGHKQFKNFPEFRRYMCSQEEPEQEAEQEKAQPKTAFQEAQNVMGFSGTEPNTQTELKARHRQLLSILHPDKGCPTNLFAQQVNEAASTIMAERKWK